jgi:hypothetical protein
MSKNLVFEFSGVVRVLARQREAYLTIADTATWRDVLAALASATPALVGEVIAKDRRSLIGDYLINVNGELTINHLDERVEAPDGAHLIFLTDTC